jgi:hypothetical protein
MTNVIPFPPKDGVFGISSEFTFEPEDFIESRLPFSFDIVQHEAEGIVCLEACVPVAMATVFLEMLVASKAVAAPFSFGIVPHAAEGMVFLEACVPAAMATVFLEMLIASKAAAAA